MAGMFEVVGELEAAGVIKNGEVVWMQIRPVIEEPSALSLTIFLTVISEENMPGLIFADGLTVDQLPPQSADYACRSCGQEGGWQACVCPPEEQCRHGMSLWLCADPINHYPPDL